MRTWIIAAVAGIALAIAASHAPAAWAKDPCLTVVEALEVAKGKVTPLWKAVEAARFPADGRTVPDAEWHPLYDEYKRVKDAEMAKVMQALRDNYNGPVSDNEAVQERLMAQWEMQCLRSYGYVK